MKNTFTVSEYKHTHTAHNIRRFSSVSTDLTLYILHATMQHFVKTGPGHVHTRYKLQYTHRLETHPAVKHTDHCSRPAASQQLGCFPCITLRVPEKRF